MSMTAEQKTKSLNDHKNGVSALTMPTGHKVLLMTANGTASARGTELASGGGYVAATGLALTWKASTNASPSVGASNGVTSQTNMPAATVVGIEVVYGANVRIEYGALTASRTTSAGDTLSFADSAITTSLG